MSPEQWQKIKQIFDQLADAGPDERQRVLSELDPLLRKEAESLLQNHEAASQLLTKPVVTGDLLAQIGMSEARCFRTGDRIGDRYEIREFVGAGGMGEVYQAYDEHLRVLIALKTVRLDLALDSKLTERFRTEVQCARRVTHPNICRIHDLSTTMTRSGIPVPFLTMEYLNGTALRDLIRASGGLKVEEVYAIGLQLCSALSAAHMAGVLHRDLKSANVILRSTPNGVMAILTDFGLAGTVGEDADLPAEAYVLGTPAYLSPELLEGASGSVSSDIYALGVLLYEMATGRFPFEASNDPASTAIRRRRPPTPPRNFVPDLPRRLEQTIICCLATNPAHRPASAEEVRESLTGKWLVRAINRRPGVSRRRVLIAGSVAGLAAAGGALLYHARGSSDAKHTVLVEDFEALDHKAAIAGSAAQLIRIALAQSPWLKLVNETTAEVAARRNGLEPGHVRGETALSVARSSGADVVVGGTLIPNSGAYFLRLTIRDASSGRTLHVQEHLWSVQTVADATGQACAAIRKALGEDSETIRSHSRVLEQPDTLNPEALNLYTRGLDAYRQGETEAALGFLEAATNLDPAFALAYVYQALVQSALRRSEKAFSPARKAFELRQQTSGRARHFAEWIYYSLSEDLDRALDKARVMAAMYPADAQMQRSVAQAYSRMAKLEDAIRHGREAFRLDGQNPLNAMILAGILAQANLPDEALEIIRHARADTGDKPVLHSGEGFAYLVKGRVDDALASFTRLMEADRDLEPLAKAYRAICLLYAGRFRQASDQLEADIVIAEGREDHATEDQRRYWLGQTLILEDQRGAAISHARKLAARPPIPPYLFALRSAGELCHASGDGETLDECARKLNLIRSEYSSTTSEAYALHLAGLRAQLKGQPGEARSLLERAHSVRPDLASTWALARFYHANRLYSEANPRYEQIVAARGTALRFDSVVLWGASIGNSALCSFVLGHCEFALKRREEFRQLWGKLEHLSLVQEVLHTERCAAAKA